jgi:hypothetical protein
MGLKNFLKSLFSKKKRTTKRSKNRNTKKRTTKRSKNRNTKNRNTRKMRGG